MDHRPSPSSASKRAGRGLGLALGAAPHVLILALMVLEILNAEGTDRGYAALAGLFELYVVPIALIAAFVLRATRFRPLSSGLVISTLVGTLIVVLAMLVVGNGSTWD